MSGYQIPGGVYVVQDIDHDDTQVPAGITAISSFIVGGSAGTGGGAGGARTRSNYYYVT